VLTSYISAAVVSRLPFDTVNGTAGSPVTSGTDGLPTWVKGAAIGGLIGAIIFIVGAIVGIRVLAKAHEGNVGKAARSLGVTGIAIAVIVATTGTAALTIIGGALTTFFVTA
jgi:hypothetical protein